MLQYTSWLEDNKDKISAADYERYQKQHELCKQVVAKYESPDFDDKNEAKAKELMDLMQKVCRKRWNKNERMIH